jgi:SAM-dependent methyltransferase
MVMHLQAKVRGIERIQSLRGGDWVLDIGSNDGTLLNSYQTRGLKRVGIDPTAEKFRKFYSTNIVVVADFFSSDRYLEASSDQLAKVITSVAMFYDLEDPAAFVRDVRRSLAPDGIWHFEQSYMPYMLRTTSYDTICHEHLEYYSLGVVHGLLERHGLRIIDVQMNGVNGGSFAVTACHDNAPFPSNRRMIDWLLQQEKNYLLDLPTPYRRFEERVFKHRIDLQHLLQMLIDDGKRVIGYGASTKGNVLLQFCKFGPEHLNCIAEVNPDKFGAFTPGTRIPIVSEADAHAMRPDYFLVLPWHFKEVIVQREKDYLAAGGKIIFPLPEIEIFGG